ncbi:hypothetical protein [Methylocystis parvus]|uniref:Uncharacterized protein n=1 Tax=Methylocystis parvus TaxID=134 RepID=A0A6B8MAQ0_9HYPH|nr:hypothetical protein [Methylocystis parvus]QGM98363.1 hypothetical protein F7D14_13330 [Methylocystis parvus]WBK01309.1 hypothetical protein MMG94_06245 [Methylocystis parvus OBBP]
MKRRILSIESFDQMRPPSPPRAHRIPAFRLAIVVALASVFVLLARASHGGERGSGFSCAGIERCAPTPLQL